MTKQIRAKSGVVAYVKTRNVRIEAEHIRMVSKKSGSQPCCGHILDKKLAAKPISSIMELRQRLEGGWNDISQLSCLNLIDSIPSRIQKCLKSKEGYFM